MWLCSDIDLKGTPCFCRENQAVCTEDSFLGPELCLNPMNNGQVGQTGDGFLTSLLIMLKDLDVANPSQASRQAI